MKHMNHGSRRLFLLATCALAAALAYYFTTRPVQLGTYISPKLIGFYSPLELSSLKTKALSGDSYAAMDLYRYYSKIWIDDRTAIEYLRLLSSESTNSDTQNTIRIAQKKERAKAGDGHAALDLYMYYAQVVKDDSRALEYLHEARTSGCFDPEDVLRKCGGADSAVVRHDLP